MKTWLRVRHAWWMVAALIAMVSLDQFVGGLRLSVPDLFGGGASALFLSTFLPLIWAAAVADSVAGRGLSVETRPAYVGRSPFSQVGLHDAGLFASAAITAAALFSISAGNGFSGLGPVLILAGVSCVATLRAGPAVGIFLCTMLMLATSVYPRLAPARRFVRFLQPDGDPLFSSALGITAMLVAIAFLVTNSARTRFRSRDAAG